MNKKKYLFSTRILSALLCLALVLTGVPLNASAEGTEVQTEQNTAAVSAGDATVSAGDAVVTFPTVTVPAPMTELPDNDELFSGYAEQYIFGMGGNAATFAALSSNRLTTAADKAVYAALKTEIEKVAANGGSSQFTLDVTNMGVTFTVTAISDNTLSGSYNIDVSKIIDALLEDCPYELYWYDKTASMTYGTADSFSSTLQAGNVVELKTLVFDFPVAAAYQDTSATTPTYTVSAAGVATALAAKTNADNVIKEALKKTTVYDQLLYCLDYIKTNVAYGNPGSSDKNTWQMIWAFDGNPDTNVVCEGYAKAFKYLCDGIGVECYTVSGTMSGGTGAGAHMWNIVVLGEKSYLVDPTNCDGDESSSTNTVGYPDKLFLKAPTNGTAETSYVYKISDENIVTYIYDSNTISLFNGTDILTLAGESYVLYTVTITDSENGTITATPSSGTKDTTVTLTVTPAEGYDLDTLKVTYGEDSSVTEVTVTDNKFTMPAGNVTVSATFKLHSHSFGTNGVCACGISAAAKIVSGETTTYYATLSAAAEKAVSGDTIKLLTNVTIGTEETITFAEGVTLDANGQTITNNGTVKIGESDGIIFENKLYYYGGDVTSDQLGISSETKITYYKAGEGYAIYDGNSILTLHNATIASPDNTNSGSENMAVSTASVDLTIRFSGTNTISAGSAGSLSRGISTEVLTLEGKDENSVLRITSGYAFTGSSEGISCENLTVFGGTVYVTGGNCGGGSSTAISASDTVFVNGTLNTDFGVGSGVNAGVVCKKLSVGASGTVNGLVTTVDIDEAAQNITVIFTIYGNTVLSTDMKVLTAEDTLVTFTVPTDTSLTVNSGVTLDLSALTVDNIDFFGTVTNNGTIKLPTAYTYDTIPEKLNGTVAIGDKSYTWSSEKSKWICGVHTDTNNDHNCEVCGEKNISEHSYGELIPATAEVHSSSELKPAVDAHYICSVCGTYFTANKTETTLEDLAGETPTHVHHHYSSDYRQHYSLCSCYYELNSGAHTYDETTHKCTTCGRGESFSVTMIANDDERTTSNTICAYGGSLDDCISTIEEDYSHHSMTKTGHEWSDWAWFTDEACTIPYNGTTMPAQALYLAGQWNPNTYTITWTVDDETSTTQQTYNVTLTLPEEPAKTGCKFLGWFTAADGGEQVTGETVYTTAGNTTYYAHFCDHERNTNNTFTDNGDGISHSRICSICAGPIIGSHNASAYSAEGAVITNSCIYCDAKTGTATISAENASYTGSAYDKAFVTGTGTLKDWFWTINYCCTDGCKDVKTHTASITIGEGENAATASVEFTIAKADPAYTIPTDLTAVYGQTLADVTLPEAENGTWSWIAEKVDSALVGNPGTQTHKAAFMPNDTANYNTIEVDITITVAKATPIVTPPTAVSGLVYNGSEQNLVIAGSTTFDRLRYKVGDGEWSTDLPTVTNAGEYTVWYKVVGNNYYNDVAEQSITVTIDPKNIAGATVTLDETTITYDGKEHKPGVTVTLDGKNLTKGTDYKVSYRIAGTMSGNVPTAWLDQDNTFTDVGIMYYAVVEGMGNYYTENDTTLYANFRITSKTVTEPTFAGLNETYAYTGSAIKPTFKLMDGTMEIPANEYTVSYSKNTDIGTATITITDKVGGNYTISGTATFEIKPHAHDWSYTAEGATITAECSGTIGDCTVENRTASITLKAPSDCVYNGTEKIVTVDGTIENVQTPTVSYTGDRKNAGSFTASMKLGDATAALTVTITAKALTDEMVTLSENVIYNGSEQKPTVTVKDGTATLTAGTDYTVSFPADMINAGEKTIAVTGKGNYQGQIEKTFIITDTTKPTGEIKIQDNSWKQFLNTITFGLFFRNNVDVTITADGTGSDVAKVEYLLSGIALNETALPTEGWIALTADNGQYRFAITSQNKTVVYVRITDNGGNAAVINSNGIVVYEDSEVVDAEVHSTYGSTQDITVKVEPNGNTIKDVRSSAQSWIETGYCTVDGDTITLNGQSLARLGAGSYNLTVSYHPMGVENSGVTDLTTTFIVNIDKAQITTATVDVTAPEAGEAKQTTVSGGTSYSAVIIWDCDTDTFGYNTAYTATVTLTADRNHKFASSLTVSGWNVAVSANGLTATLTKTYEATRKALLTGISELKDVTLEKYYTDAAEAAKELPDTVSYTTESGLKSVAIQWTCENYDPTVKKTNEFVWTVKDGELDAYDQGNAAVNGSITVTNADALNVNNSGENKEIIYNGSTYDVKQMFTIDENAGEASYAIVSGGTGEGTLNGSVLTITKPGTIKIKLTTEAEGAYAAGEANATLTVNKGTGAGTVEIAGWTYGKTAKTPVTNSSTNGTANVTYLYESTDSADYSSSDAPVNAGSYRLTATFAETDLYKACTDEVTFTIEQKELTAALDGAATKVYDKTNAVPADNSLFIVLAGIVDNDDVKASAAYAYDGVNVGTTKVNATGITLDGTDKANYKLASAAASAEVGTITQAEPEYTVPANLQATCGDTLAEVTLPEGFAWEDALTTEVGDVGSNEFTVTYVPEDSLNYKTVTGITVSIKVKLEGSITDITDLSKTYDGTAVKNPSFTTTSVSSGDAVTVEYKAANADDSTYTTEAPAEAGSYKVRVTVAEDELHKECTSTADFTIAKRDIADAEIVLGESLTYNGTQQTQSVSSVTVMGQKLDANSYKVTGNTATEAGTYTLTVTITDHKNFTGSATKEYVIGKIQLPDPAPEDAQTPNQTPSAPETTPETAPETTPETTLETENVKSAATGDNSNAEWYLLAMLLAGAALISLLMQDKRKRV